MTLTDLPVLGVRRATPAGFVRFWSACYDEGRYGEEFYRAHIGRPLDEKSVGEWFRWKNGMRLSGGKGKSILRYHEEAERVAADAPRDEVERFLNRKGGVIWRVFLLHLRHPAAYPIYDQHVHRAMAVLLGRDATEIPARGSERARSYLTDFRPFFTRFAGVEPREVDRALWSFGKFVKSSYGRRTLGSLAPGGSVD